MDAQLSCLCITILSSISSGFLLIIFMLPVSAVRVVLMIFMRVNNALVLC